MREQGIGICGGACRQNLDVWLRFCVLRVLWSQKWCTVTCLLLMMLISLSIVLTTVSNRLEADLFRCFVSRSFWSSIHISLTENKTALTKFEGWIVLLVHMIKIFRSPRNLDLFLKSIASLFCSGLCRSWDNPSVFLVFIWVNDLRRELDVLASICGGILMWKSRCCCFHDTSCRCAGITVVTQTWKRWLICYPSWTILHNRLDCGIGQLMRTGSCCRRCRHSLRVLLVLLLVLDLVKHSLVRRDSLCSAVLNLLH